MQIVRMASEWKRGSRPDGFGRLVSRGNFFLREGPAYKNRMRRLSRKRLAMSSRLISIQLEAWIRGWVTHDLRRADRETISDENIALQQTGCREVFTESAPR